MEIPATEKAPINSRSYRTILKVVAIVGVIVVAVCRVLVPATPFSTGLDSFSSEHENAEILGYSSPHTAAPRSIDRTNTDTNGDTNDNDNDEGKSRPIRVACVGDSITYKGCVTNLNYTYPSQLSRFLGPGYEVTNYGKSGKTMLKQGLCCNEHNETWNCSYWNTSEFRAAIHSSPDIVTIMLGTNDAKRCNWYGPPNGSHEYFLDYVDMVKVFLSLPSPPKIYLAIPPPLVHPPTHPTRPFPLNMDDTVINNEFPVLVPEIAQEFQSKFNTTIGVIDVWSAMGGTAGYEDPTMTCDGCHPKKHAFAIIAGVFASAIVLGDVFETKNSLTAQTPYLTN